MLSTTIRVAERYGPPFTGSRAPFDSSDPLVFTHHNLNMRNFPLDRLGKVRLLNFGWPGFHPPVFEYYGMRQAAINDRSPKSCMYSIPFMAGIYFKERLVV
ncbi:hypothetical protein SCP_0600890 [Sparassis crispa]|uniref:Aminoglycoside phosphotransferase domain-containing protein n=1 Tax=Sparassis crispa TaxID=139825 RepID=A0A401GPE4_9APHY|nr:hypothetical protein SCP_0600890 [Sparassis crispa]GBE84111.1 hypothetical protein SCP_0600890 [Sparassis crispa]